MRTKPFREQAKAPCKPNRHEVELSGGLAKKPPSMALASSALHELGMLAAYEDARQTSRTEPPTHGRILLFLIFTGNLD